MKKEYLKIYKSYFINDTPIEFEFGKAYIFFSSKLQIQKKIFESYKNRTIFINSPFKEAIKVPTYFENHFKLLEEIKDKINDANYLSFKINRYSLIEKILLILVSKLGEKDIAVVETTGLDNDSIFKLLSFSSNYLLSSPNKLIIIMDFNFVIGNQLWVTKLNNETRFEEILYTIPLNNRRIDKYPFYLESE